MGEDKAVYPKDPLCHYTHTKMVAEKAVLAANDGPNGLLTGVIRPNAIYGPRDVRFVPCRVFFFEVMMVSDECHCNLTRPDHSSSPS